MKPRAEIIKEMEELEDLLIDDVEFESKLYSDLLADYEIRCIALQLVNDSYPLEQAIRFQDIRETLERQMSRLSEKKREQYVTYGMLLAICLEPIKKEK